jgi:uncharacterized protein (TIGR02246 family)
LRPADAKTRHLTVRHHLCAVPAQPPSTANSDVRALIEAFANARNAHDGNSVAAFYSDDGEWIANDGSAVVRGKVDLARMWSRVTGHVDRTVKSVEFAGRNIAMVYVTTQYEAPIGRHSEVFVLVYDTVWQTPESHGLGAWKIRVHQTLD